jgi:redox-sensitive bicupin YhaK (pirin superfamily)
MMIKTMTRNVVPVALLLIAFSDVTSSFSNPQLGSRRRAFLSPLASSAPNGDTVLSSPSPSSKPSGGGVRSVRRVESIEKNARLPVWPAWNGVLIFLANRVLGDAAAAKLENTITGRVCPNFFEYQKTSPFIMLVHHCHSFAPWDPLRFFQRTFFPEGFPSHAHRGFVTVTYFLDGGFVHRDSMGVRQTYGAEPRHEGKHTQWLTTGAGILHEEMYDLAGNGIMPERQELYQLWLNLPAGHKLDSPSVLTLGGDNETPLVTVTDDQDRITETLVLAGEYQDRSSAAPLESDLAIMHVKMEEGTTWTYSLPENYENVILYLRQGSLTSEDGTLTLPVHHTVQFGATGSELVLHAPTEAADFMILAGEPIREPCVAQGSMVMNTNEEINRAYQEYQSGNFGQPWSEKLSDAEWKDHVRKFPSRYQEKH